MKKIVIHRAGGYNQLKVEEHPMPAPGPGEVLLKVSAAGINFADIVIRQGLYESAKLYVGWPITPGFEVAGEVVAAGPGATVAIGTQVWAVTRFGGYSSHVVVPAEQVWPLPKNWRMEEAAAFPAVFLTAYHALFQHFLLRPNMKVLVHSAAGGVGSALCQMLRIAGCETVGVVGGPHKVEVAKRYGASVVIDKSREDLWARAKELAPAGYDVILDGNGPSTLRQSYEHLAPVSKLVAYGFHSMFSRKGGYPNYLKLGLEFLRIPRFSPLAMHTKNVSLVTFNLSFLFDRKDLLEEGVGRLRGWIDEGKLQPLPVTPYKAEHVAEAHRALESGRTTGKLVLQFND
jgi:NADPH:quinone reductase-like Zn-dependent oxidoreductase